MFFFSYLKEQNLFCMFKREQSSMYWAIEKSKQTSTNNFWTNSSKQGNMKTHILRTFLSHLFFNLSTTVFFTVRIQTLMSIHCSCYSQLVAFYIQCQSMNVMVTLKYITSVFYKLYLLHPFFFGTVCRPLGLPIFSHQNLTFNAKHSKGMLYPSLANIRSGIPAKFFSVKITILSFRVCSCCRVGVKLKLAHFKPS